jgi:hypothetical protein
MRVPCFLAALILAGVCVSASAQASRFEFSGGAGFSDPTGNAGDNLNMGWNLDFRGGYRPIHHLSLDLDFNYNRWNLNSAALARYNEPGGYTTVWSFSFLPVFRAAPRWNVTPYIMGGPGIYSRNLSLTQPGIVNSYYCDPFFGYCYPSTYGVNQVVASSTTYKLGISGGAGLEYRLGQSHWKVFGEARYAEMFTNHGQNFTFVPVTFGVRW